MSRKHYTQVASDIARRMEQSYDRSGLLSNSDRDTYAAGYRNALRDLADDLADMFKADNPRFDRARFLNAANVTI